jgi:hypothetical protein
LPETVNQYQVKIYDMLGRTVYEKNNNIDKELQISLTKFSQGTYMVIVESEESMWTQKFIKYDK